MTISQDSGYFREKLGQSVTKLFRTLPPETAHEWAMKLLNTPALEFIKPKSMRFEIPLSVNIPGLGSLNHPIGLAAGFDKNGVSILPLASLGFSFIEIGTVTPLAQPGNSKPRLIRQAGQRALVNRMGFNNDGSEVIHRRVINAQSRIKNIPIGINAGVNKLTSKDNSIWDYLQVIKQFSNDCSYMVINVSSPNTKGLRDLADDSFISQFSSLLANQSLINNDKIWFKLDPDRDKKSFQKIIESICKHDFAGIILTNTHKVNEPFTGGQSGHPLLIQSTRCLEWAWEIHKGKLPMIGCGGILSGSDVFQKIIRGAHATQIYTAFIYRGPWVVQKMLNELEAELRKVGAKSIDELIGSFYQ